jgi:hypothetical protein
MLTRRMYDRSHLLRSSGLLTLVVQFRFLKRLVDQIKDNGKIFPLIVGREDHRVQHIDCNEELLDAMTYNPNLKRKR